MSDAHTIAVTGATGFIGYHLCRELARRGFAVRAIVRRADAANTSTFAIGALQDASDATLDEALAGVQALVHLAGRAHVLDERAGDPEAAYDQANREATDRLAAAAARAGVARFVLASSVKVNGEASAPGHAFRPDDVPAPLDAYGRSKLAAERALVARAAGTSTVALVLRLPLVYGPRVRGNFLRLLDAVGAEQRLPVGAIDNRRSLAYVGNVVDAIATVLAGPSLPQGVHFVADRECVSTPELVRALAQAMGERPRLVAVPVSWLRLAARVLGRTAEIERLTGSLEVDPSAFMAATGWTPLFTLAQGLAATAAWWRARHSI